MDAPLPAYVLVDLRNQGFQPRSGGGVSVAGILYLSQEGQIIFSPPSGCKFWDFSLKTDKDGHVKMLTVDKGTLKC